MKTLKQFLNVSEGRNYPSFSEIFDALDHEFEYDGFDGISVKYLNFDTSGLAQIIKLDVETRKEEIEFSFEITIIARGMRIRCVSAQGLADIKTETLVMKGNAQDCAHDILFHIQDACLNAEEQIRNERDHEED